MIRILLLTYITLLLFLNYGCVPTAGGVVAGTASTGMILSEGDKTIGTAVDDATIKLNISTKFLKAGNNLFLNVDARVVEGRVLLTGIVDTQEIRIEAVTKVWEVRGVIEVINEIEVGDQKTIRELASDFKITSQIKALAAKDIGFRALHYNIETIKGKVYIAGVTSRPEQLEMLINIIKGVKGVKEIVNYVVVKE